MDNKIKIVVVGVCGYGSNYLQCLPKFYKKYNAELVGAIDTNFNKSEILSQLQSENIPCFFSLDEFYKNNKADLVIIAAPIHFHKELSILAMKNGSHVLCEKPVAGSVADALEMKEASEKYNKMLAIGFQWSYIPENLNLKLDILNGKWGKAKLLKTLVLWPRATTYYTERSWAGKQYARDGRIIMDSIASNATSHYLHNMFFLLGDSLKTSVGIKNVVPKLYRANDIETFDTCNITIETDNGANINFFASHCVEDNYGPVFTYYFEKGRITYSYVDKTLRGTFNDGEEVIYGDLSDNWHGVDAMLKAISENDSSFITCDIDTAMSHLKTMDIVNSGLDQVIIPGNIKKIEKDAKTFMIGEGIAQMLTEAYHMCNL